MNDVDSVNNEIYIPGDFYCLAKNILSSKSIPSDVKS